MVSWPHGPKEEDRQPRDLPPEAEFIAKQWKVAGNVIVVVPNDRLDENSPPVYDQSSDSDHILVGIPKGKFLALDRSTELRTESEGGFLAAPMSSVYTWCAAVMFHSYN